VFEVMERQCSQCLFSDKKIVSKIRMREILRECEKKGIEFQCHKGTIEGKVICCKGFWDTYKMSNRKLRMAEALKVVRFVGIGE